MIFCINTFTVCIFKTPRAPFTKGGTNFYPTVCVTFKIAQNIANANHTTNHQATSIAIGSIHLVKLQRE